MPVKNYVVMMRFDPDTDAKLLALHEKLDERGYKEALSSWPPHITIAAYEGIPIEELLGWTGEYAEKHKRFEVSLSALGVLPPGEQNKDTAVLFASPSPSKDLIGFYNGFHERLDGYCGRLGRMYASDFPYMIHSTIGIFNIKAMQGAMEIVFEERIFGRADVVALEVYTYPMELIQRFALKN